MRRFLTVTAVFCIAAAIFTGCSKQNAAGTKIPLRYLAWNLGTAEENNLERRMLTAFQEAHPEAQLTILEVPKNPDGSFWGYTDYLNSLAAQSNLPDVFMLASVPEAAGNGWAYNISDYALKDPDYQKVIPALRDNAQLNGHVYAVPNQAHLFGLAANLTIFEELNVQPLPFTYTIEDLQAKIAQVTTNKYKGIDNFGIEDWGPPVIDRSLGFGTFDGEGYRFTSPAFAQAVAIYRDIVSRGQTGNGGLIPASAWLPEGVSWAWGEGYVSLQYEATWSLMGFVNGERPFKADLMPLPNEKVVLVPDFIFIGASTKQPALAYELAKWMGYGSDGLEKRVELAKAAGLILNGIPLAPGAYPEVDNFFLQNYRSLRNFMQLYQMIQQKPENVILESYKVVPGYDLSRFSADTGVLGTVDGAEKSLTMRELINSIIKGERQLADYAAEMERIANGEYQKAFELIRNK
jgi:multiple sugar transport system substrate-binding protein